MYQNQRVAALIPAFNEADAIGQVVSGLLAVQHNALAVFDTIIVCDNASTDATAQQAELAGATVVYEARKGYGAACLRAIAAAKDHDIVVFVDGDHSAYATDTLDLLAAIVNPGADLVIGSRTLGDAAAGALTPQQVWGNWLATRLISIIWQTPVTDLGPLRAIRSAALQRLEMTDPTFGWTVEMQTKAFMHNLRVAEVPVRTRVRIGSSKISGTLSGTIKAGYGILSTVAKYAWLHFNRERIDRSTTKQAATAVDR